MHDVDSTSNKDLEVSYIMDRNQETPMETPKMGTFLKTNKEPFQETLKEKSKSPKKTEIHMKAPKEDDLSPIKITKKKHIDHSKAVKQQTNE